MIDIRDFGLFENPQNREEQLCVNYGYEKMQKKNYSQGYGMRFFLDCWHVETMSFLYTIVILKVGLLSYSILKFLFYMVYDLYGF